MLHEHEIRKIREAKGFSQHYMAKQLNMSQNNYWKIENGQADVKLGILKQLAVILNVDIVQLIVGPGNGPFASPPASEAAMNRIPTLQQQWADREQLHRQLLESKAQELLLQQQLLSKQKEITRLLATISRLMHSA